MEHKTFMLKYSPTSINDIVGNIEQIKNLITG